MKSKHLKNVIIILAVSILITFLFDRIYGGSGSNFYGIVLNILYGVTIGTSISLSGLLTQFILKKSSIELHPMRTYVVLLVSIFLFISIDVIVINALWYKFTQGIEFSKIFTNVSIIISTVITIFIGLTIFFILLSKNFMSRLLDAEKEIQNAKHEADKSKFEILKSQINPHFLFNSLNSLSSLIHIDVDKADEFTNKLSSIYRYILDHQDDNLVTLTEEIEFIRKYIVLQSIRFDDSFSVEIKDVSDYQDMLIIPLSLQLLLENVFKHNIISEKNRITISICVSDNYLIIKNNKNNKNDVGVSHNVGLSNITTRYQLVCDRECIIENTETEFVVRLPLIPKD
ncbi:MAG: sensor histidine kinase [Bacteroidota bacterium]